MDGYKMMISYSLCFIQNLGFQFPVKHYFFVTVQFQNCHIYTFENENTAVLFYSVQMMEHCVPPTKPAYWGNIYVLHNSI